jgi:hypothetical protein
MTPGARSRDWLYLALVFVGICVWLWAARPARDNRGYDASTIARGEQLEELGRTHTLTSFRLLSSFPYVSVTSPAIRQYALRPQIPAQVLALNGRRVALDGFMLPLDITSEGVRTFLLNASYDMCQYGAPVVINQQVEVTMTRGRRTAYTHSAMRVFGTLEVGEAFSRGELVSLYRLQAEAVGPPGLGYY